MAEENEEKGFTVTDKRFSSQSEEENKKADAEKNELKSNYSEEANKETPKFTIDFSSFVLSLSAQALIQLGQINDPVTNQPAKDLEAAKHTIDILGIIEDKTKGNLTPEEQKTIDGSLYDLRMMFLNHTK